MDDLEAKIKAKKQEVRELENKNKIKKLQAELDTIKPFVKALREIPAFKGKKDNEILAEIEAKFPPF